MLTYYLETWLKLSFAKFVPVISTKLAILSNFYVQCLFRIRTVKCVQWRCGTIRGGGEGCRTFWNCFRFLFSGFSLKTSKIFNPRPRPLQLYAFVFLGIITILCTEIGNKKKEARITAYSQQFCLPLNLDNIIWNDGSFL